MVNYKLTVAYDGSRYKGWQRLGFEHTVQGKLEEVLSQMFDQKIEIVGAGRTDAGVHALGQVANFKTNAAAAPEEIKNYLNRYLPDDISIVEARQAEDGFHARYMASAKIYCYRIWNRPEPNPYHRKYSLHITQKLDLTRLRQAAREIVGRHDFSAFTTAKSKKKSMVREIYGIWAEETEGFVEIRIRGNGFLHNMVRRMVGTLIEISAGRLEAEKLLELLEKGDRSGVPRVAEAKGLFLEKVEFEQEVLG